jgi:hypothetical protein
MFRIVGPRHCCRFPLQRLLRHEFADHPPQAICLGDPKERQPERMAADPLHGGRLNHEGPVEVWRIDKQFQ